MRRSKVFLVALALGLILQSAASQTTGVSAFGDVLIEVYRIDATRSQFMVRAPRGGLLWFKGHDHFFKVGSFTGEVRLTPNVINPASLQMTIRADSLEETGADFTPQQKQIINKELDEIALESAKYPEITFRSTDVTGKFNGSSFEAQVGGEMMLHGVTRRVVIPATVTLNGDDLRAKGEFTIDRKDFNVKATTAVKGLVRVKHELKFTFDILASRGKLSKSASGKL